MLLERRVLCIPLVPLLLQLSGGSLPPLTLFLQLVCFLPPKLLLLLSLTHGNRLGHLASVGLLMRIALLKSK